MLGLCLLIAGAAREAIGLLAVVGATSSTLYTAHILWPARSGGPACFAWLAQVLGGLVISWLLRATGRRGPLEAVVGAAVRQVRGRLVDGARR